MNSKLSLRQHFKDLIFWYLALSERILVLAAQRKRKGLFFLFEPVVFISLPFVINDLNLIPSQIRLVAVSQLILVLNPDQHNQKPFVDDSVVVKIFFRKFYQRKLHVEKYYRKAPQLIIIYLAVTLMDVLSGFPLLYYLLEFGQLILQMVAAFVVRVRIVAQTSLLTM